MPTNKEQLEASEEEKDYEEFDESDYAFVISPEGELKSIMFPEDSMDDPPKEIKRILKIFGIKDLNEIGPRTIH